MKIEKGYKIVSRTRKRGLISAFSETELALEYRVGEWTYPKVEGSMLFVIPAYKIEGSMLFVIPAYNARIRSSNNSLVKPILVAGGYTITPDLELYECEMLNPRSIGLCGIPYNASHCKWLWRQMHDVRHRAYSDVVAEAVRLTKLKFTPRRPSEYED